MVTKNNEQIVLNLIKVYDNIINKLYNAYPNKIEPLKHSWEFSCSKYKKAIENNNVPISKLRNGLSQGFCEIPFILQSILTTEEFNFAYDIYKDEIKNTEAEEIINNLLYKKSLNIIKKEQINNEDEFWIAQLMIDLSSKNTDYLNESEIKKLMQLVDNFNSQ